MQLSSMGELLKKKLEADINNMGLAVSEDEVKEILKQIIKSENILRIFA